MVHVYHSFNAHICRVSRLRVWTHDGWVATRPIFVHLLHLFPFCDQGCLLGSRPDLWEVPAGLLQHRAGKDLCSQTQQTHCVNHCSAESTWWLNHAAVIEDIQVERCRNAHKTAGYVFLFVLSASTCNRRWCRCLNHSSRWLGLKDGLSGLKELTGVCSDCCSPSPQEAIQLDGEILYALLHKVSPTAHRHLKKHSLEPILYMTEWFMCAFSRTLPWASVLRIWDMFLCEGKMLEKHRITSGLSIIWSSSPTSDSSRFKTTRDFVLRGKDPLPSGPRPPKVHAGLPREAEVLPRSLRDDAAPPSHTAAVHAGELPGAGGAVRPARYRLSSFYGPFLQPQPFSSLTLASRGCTISCNE